MQKSKYGMRKVFRFTLPMILTALSMSLMFNVDRLVLAHYSVDSMNAAALAGNFVAMVSFVFICIAQIATIFVGQYNGLEEYHKTGWAPWQMVYLGLASFLIFIPLAVYCHHFHIFPAHYEKEGLEYLRILIAFSGGMQTIASALSAFFIGRGKSFIIICVVFFVNVINFFINILLVFGVNEVIEPMGIKGSATATAIGESLHVLILLSVFLNPKNREKYSTCDNKFRWEVFSSCVKTGFPLSCGKVLSLLGWFIILEIFNRTSKDLATLEAFSISIWIIFIFFAEGGGRALSSMSANLIGENNLPEIRKLLRWFLVMNFALCIIFSIPLVFYQVMMFWFLDGVNGDLSHLRSEFQFLFISMWVMILTDGIYYTVCGVLSSGGDTKFPMYLELSTLWLMGVIPTFLLYATGNLTSIRVTYTLLPISGVINAIVSYRRYTRLKWFNRLV
jgi:MATE family multidrug resistance protein